MYFFKRKMRLTKNLFQRIASSEILQKYLLQQHEPPWTSYFVKLSDCKNDLKGKTSFNFKLPSGANYHILRTWCYPYIKFHCTKTDIKDLEMENRFYELIKILNLGIPLLCYGVAAIYLIKHEEDVLISQNQIVKIYFLIPEDKGSRY